MQNYCMTKGKEISIKYLTVIILFIIESLASANGSFVDFALGTYLALIYARLNVPVVSILFIICSIISKFSLEGLFTSVFQVLLLSVFYIIHYFSKKGLNKIFIGMYSVILSIPNLVFHLIMQDGVDIFIYSIKTIVLVLFTIVSCIFFNAFFLKKNLLFFSIEEKTTAFIYLTIFSLGVYSLEILQYKPFYIVVYFLLLYLIEKHSITTAIFIMSSVILGAAIYENDLGLLGQYLLILLAGFLFKNLNILFAAISIILVDIGCGIYFNNLGVYSFQHVVMVIAGICLYLIIPKKIRNTFYSTVINNSLFKETNIYEQKKDILITKLQSAEKVLINLVNIYEKESLKTKSQEEKIKEISDTVESRTCKMCVYKDSCGAYEKDRNKLIENLVKKAVEGGIISPSDFTKPICDYCKTYLSIAAYVNNFSKQYVINYSREIENKKQLALMNEEMKAVLGMLITLEGKVNSQIIINEEMQKRLKEELGFFNIVCHYISIVKEDNSTIVRLIVRKQDDNKKVLVQILEKFLKLNFQKQERIINLQNNLIGLEYVTKPKFDIVYYSLVKPKGKSLVSGDSQCIVKLNRNKVLIILCDGMGKGGAAHKSAVVILDLIQNFYKADFNEKEALSLINRALSMLNKECFVALDLCVLDLETGVCDFIKLGAVQSFIRKEMGVEIINSDSLPIGIVDEAKPKINRRVITTKEYVVLVSDGIMDSLHLEGISYIVNEINSSNPKNIAEEIFRQAIRRGIEDDASIIVFKLTQLLSTNKSFEKENEK